MYGMIHKSVRDMVQKEFGEESWNEIAASAGVDEAHLLSMEAYDDEIVYNLVDSASKLLGLSSAEILETFGQHFVLTTLNAQYKQLLLGYGKTCFELLDNINYLHSSIKSTFTGYLPPIFSLEHVNDFEIDLVYESPRVGLTPFVRGLLNGLAILYMETLVISEEEHITVESGEKTRFRVCRES
jgi:hypothetical protein